MARKTETERIMNKTCLLIPATLVIFAATLTAQQLPSQSVAGGDSDDSNVRPLVTRTDVRIVRRAKKILRSPSTWNRADTRICPPDAKIFSLYCALEKATGEEKEEFRHRSAAMQEARFVIDDIAPNRKNYQHRLMDYNNDPSTTFADIKTFFHLLEERISKRLAEQSKGASK